MAVWGRCVLQASAVRRWLGYRYEWPTRSTHTVVDKGTWQNMTFLLFLCLVPNLMWIVCKSMGTLCLSRHKLVFMVFWWVFNGEFTKASLHRYTQRQTPCLSGSLQEKICSHETRHECTWWRKHCVLLLVYAVVWGSTGLVIWCLLFCPLSWVQHPSCLIFTQSWDP